MQRNDACKRIVLLGSTAEIKRGVSVIWLTFRGLSNNHFVKIVVFLLIL